MRQFYRPTGEERHWVVVSVPADAAPPEDWVPLDTSLQRKHLCIGRKLMKKLIGGLAVAAVAAGLFAQAEAPEVRVDAGRTNVHSDGRAGGKALPRRGEPRRHPSFGPGSLHKVSLTLEQSDEIQLVAKSVGPNTRRIKSVFGRATNGNNKPKGRR